MSEYFVDLKDLAADRDGKVSLQGSFDPGILDFDGENVRQAAPLVWEASAQRAGDEIRIVGSLRTTMESSCSRCLEPARSDIEKSFDLFFRQRDAHMFDEDDEIELTEKDTRTAFFEGTKLAVGDIMREQVLLALPMKLLCGVDCKGLCPMCGTNLNLGSCNCSKELLTPQMEKLLEIKRSLEKRSS
jgi:uncharacterized protein